VAQVLRIDSPDSRHEDGTSWRLRDGADARTALNADPDAMMMDSRSKCPWVAPLPQDVARVPGMLSDEEKRYLYWVARHAFEGWGAIVDLGPWVGCSSAALAAGLRDRGAETKVHSFDRFEWNRGYMECHLAANLPEGADFMPIFLRQTAPVKAWIEPQKMDLMRGSWTGGPIEILFVDAAKSWELNNAILQAFGPHLVPGKSRVIQQDFRHFPTVWFPLVFDSRPDVWRQVEAVESGWTVTFMPQRPLYGEGGLAPEYRAADFTFEDVCRIFRRRVDDEVGAEARVHFLTGWLCASLLHGDKAIEALLRQEIEGLRSRTRAAEHLPEAERCTGFELMNVGKLQAAEDVGRRLMQQDPGSAAFAALAGIAAIRLGHHAVASECFERVTALDPGDVNAGLHLAEVHVEQGHRESAMQRITAALRSLSKDDYKDLLSLAFGVYERWCWKFGTWPLAELKALSARFDSVPDYHVLMAISLAMTGNRPLAWEALRRALTIDPVHARAREIETRYGAER
jgi:tetratricopeptide (TPR) repeat protein